MGLPSPGALTATFAFLRVVFTARSAGRFEVRFAILFILAFGCWVGGLNAHIAANPKKLTTGVGWSLGLIGEAGYLLALGAEPEEGGC